MEKFVAVSILPNLAKAIIPVGWIKNIDNVKIFNGGVRRHQTVEIFYCANINQEPNFELPQKDTFDGDTGCFRATLLQPFGMMAYIFVICVPINMQIHIQ